MRAYGAELILVTKEQGMEGARDLALEMAQRGEGKLLDQFNNPDNPYAHYTTTGPEIWQQTSGRITHFVSSMGTTGTITGVSRFLREQEKAVTIVGLQPEEGSSIPGIRRWPAEYMPGIFNASLVDEVLDIHQNDAENTMRELAVREGIFCGVSSGGAVAGRYVWRARPRERWWWRSSAIAAIATFQPVCLAKSTLTRIRDLVFSLITIALSGKRTARAPDDDVKRLIRPAIINRYVFPQAYQGIATVSHSSADNPMLASLQRNG